MLLSTPRAGQRRESDSAIRSNNCSEPADPNGTPRPRPPRRRRGGFGGEAAAGEGLARVWWGSGNGRRRGFIRGAGEGVELESLRVEGRSAEERRRGFNEDD